MKFHIITIFPEAFSYLDQSILKRAQGKNLIEIKIHQLRDFAKGKHHQVDDKPFGGGPGMAMQIEPLTKTLQSVKSKISGRLTNGKKTKLIFFTPSGQQFDNKIAANLAKKQQNLILLCGHYEGVDERIKKICRDLKMEFQELSVGPFVLTGGELPAMILIDVVSRRLPGVLHKEESLEENRLGVGVPVYTRPEIFVWKGKKYRVPAVLLSGNHQKIEQWRQQHKKL